MRTLTRSEFKRRKDAMKNMKRIHAVTLQRMTDSNPDTSWLGHYSSRAETDYAIDRRHSLECQSANPEAKTAIEQLERAIAYLESRKEDVGYDRDNETWTALDDSQDVLITLQSELEECDCGERGDMERGEYRYFNGCIENYQGETPEDIRKYVRQDYERMESLNRGDWGYIGVRAEAEILIPASGEPAHYVRQEITSGGLWGVESDSDAGYISEIEAEQVAELREQLQALGFSKRAVSKAVKEVTRKTA